MSREKLAFLLGQLSSDLTELIEGLRSGALDVTLAVAATPTALQSVEVELITQ